MPYIGASGGFDPVLDEIPQMDGPDPMQIAMMPAPTGRGIMSELIAMSAQQQSSGGSAPVQEVRDSSNAPAIIVGVAAGLAVVGTTVGAIAASADGSQAPSGEDSSRPSSSASSSAPATPTTARPAESTREETLARVDRAMENWDATHPEAAPTTGPTTPAPVDHPAPHRLRQHAARPASSRPATDMVVPSPPSAQSPPTATASTIDWSHTLTTGDAMPGESLEFHE